MATNAPVLQGFDPLVGFFGPGSAVWHVDRELMVLLASGQRALLMQVAHPEVAAAVVRHSRYASDPLGRLRHTLDAIYAFAFADLAGALAQVESVNRRHTRVVGTLPEAVGRHPAGAPYRALDPDLLLWVYATLVDSSLLAYERFVAPLPGHEQERYYAEMRRAGPVWGISPEVFPADLVALRAWMAELVERGEVMPGREARAVASVVLRAPARWIPQDAMRPVSAIAVWLLPPPLREGFGLPWSERQERRVQRAAAVSRWLVPRLPRALRDVPEARAAYRRLRRAR